MTAESGRSNDRFPLASKYHADWLAACVSGGANSLWLTEWLVRDLHLKPGMRVLDLGCGRAASSIFLRRELGVEVWAVDLWFDASENWQRICDAGVSDGVFPLHADARQLPFAAGFFDAVVSIDSFVYYGTDSLYLNYLARFLKPAGLLGIAGAGLIQELPGDIPAHLREWWTPELCCLQTASWWRRHWEQTRLVNVEVADALPEGWRLWAEWVRKIAPDNTPEIEAIEADQGQYLGYVRTIARRSDSMSVSPPILSIPTQYEKQPLLR